MGEASKSTSIANRIDVRATTPPADGAQQAFYDKWRAAKHHQQLGRIGQPRPRPKTKRDDACCHHQPSQAELKTSAHGSSISATTNVLEHQDRSREPVIPTITIRGALGRLIQRPRLPFSVARATNIDKNRNDLLRYGVLVSRPKTVGSRRYCS